LWMQNSLEIILNYLFIFIFLFWECEKAVFCDGCVLGVQDRMLLQYKNH